MQQMQHADNNAASDKAEALASELMEVVPLVMREIRAMMRRNRSAGLTVPQFRALVFVRRWPNCSLTAVADHLGLSTPATSRMVDTLVASGYIEREPSPTDRRFVTLRLSEQGERVQMSARSAALVQVIARLSPLTAEQRACIAEAMNPLRQAFTSEVSDESDDADHDSPTS